MFKKRKLLSGLLSLALTASSFVFSPTNVQAVDLALKTQTITFPASTTQSRSTVINIPKLISVKSITTSTGSVNYSVSGENVSITADNGAQTGTQWNPTKFSKVGTATLTSMSNNLSSTYAYNDGTYTGTINGLGVTTSSVQTGGSYTPPDTQWVSALSSSYSTSAAVPSTYNYNTNGYVGTLTGQGITQTLVSGSTGPSDTISVTYNTPTLYCTNYFVSDLMGLPAYSTYYYNVDGYVGTLPVTGYNQWQFNNYYNGYYYQIAGYLKYAGNVTRPAFDTRVWSYTQSYQGNATKPAVDTRTYATQWAQNYSGTVYAGANEPTYNYTLTLSYYDDTMALTVDPSALGVNTATATDFSGLATASPTQTVAFDPSTASNKTIKLGGKYLYATQSKTTTLGNTITTPIYANLYTTSRDGYGYADWKPVNPDGTLSEDIYYNQQGIYQTKVKFKNFTTESAPLEKDFMIDWTKPVVDAKSKIPGQTAVTGSTYTISLSATDDVSPYLLYSTDGTNWYVLQSGYNDITFTNIARSATGTVNNLTVKVSDLCGNVTVNTFTVWGIQ